MATKGKRPMRALTPGDKIEAIQRVNDGESKASVARDIGVPESTLRGWCKNEDKLRYMSSRLSSPDTDKSSDAEPADKRARTESPAARSPSPAAGLDLSAPAPAPAPPAPAPRDRRAEPGASVSMSAISPLSGLPHLPPLSHSHLGLSFNEIATNLTLLAQLGPGLTQPTGRALRSVRSPKPAHAAALNLADGKHYHRKSHHSDPYRHAAKSHAHAASATQPVDDSLWYWLKTQQAMLDLSAQTAAAHPLNLGKAGEPPQPKPAPPAATPVNAHLDYNRNSWLWQYYKQFGGAVPPPDDKLKSASQVPRDKAAENILYSHLTKGKPEEERRSATSPARPAPSPPRRADAREVAPSPPRPTDARDPPPSPPRAVDRDPREAGPAEPRAAEPGAGTENKEPVAEKKEEAPRSQTKARTVLDNLLFNNNEPAAADAGGAGREDAAEALRHGDRFLAWLEASGDPSVTRMHLHQLRSLLANLRARHSPPAHHVTATHQAPSPHHVSPAPAHLAPVPPAHH